MQMNAVGWFEIPVTDMERAIKFYETVLEVKLERHDMGEFDMAWFPMHNDKPGASGSLVKGKEYTPSMQGALIYLVSPSGDLQNELDKVEEAGGKICTPKKDIGEWGFMAVINDTEGNAVALHSVK